MGCADVCLSADFDHESPTFFSEKVVVARKPHACCECGDAISVGASYERVSGKWDGAIVVFATCLACCETRKAFCCGGWEYQALWDSINNELFPRWQTLGPWDCLAKLDTDAARAKMNARYRVWSADELAEEAPDA